eukprot:COSAG01_NODE_391_length_17672_cov_4.507369_9_plen_68_part_00
MDALACRPDHRSAPNNCHWHGVNGSYQPMRKQGVSAGHISSLMLFRRHFRLHPLSHPYELHAALIFL